MIVFIAGMQRSGSTFSFNIARDLLLRRGTVHQEASDDVLGELSRANEASHLLLKAHTMSELCVALAQKNAMRIICTVRNPEDAAASWMETFGFSEADTIAALRNWFTMYRQIRHVALTIPYELLDRNPIQATYRIARFLDPTASWREIWTIGRRHAKAETKSRVERLHDGTHKVVDIGFSQYDPETFYHRRHVTRIQSIPAEQRIGQSAVHRIRQELLDIMHDLDLDPFYYKKTRT